MKRLRVLVISHGFPPDMGGASNRAWNIARAMQANGHEVFVIAAYPYYPHGRVSPGYAHRLFTRESFEGLHVIRVWIPSLRTQGYLNRLIIYSLFTFSYSIALLLLVRRRLDVIYYVSPYPLSFFSLPAIIFRRLIGSQVFLDVADLWPEVILELGAIKTLFARTLTNWMARLVSSISDLTTPITDSIRESLVELGLPTRKLQIVELAVDTDYFKPQPAKFQDERFTGKFVAEYSGIIGPKYDFESLIQSAKIIAQRNSNVVVLIRGDGELLPQVKKLAESAGNVIVLDKIESTKAVLDYLNAAHILLCPMRDLKETSTIIPSKVLEYFAVGKPVVCSGKGETEAVMNERMPGIMVPPGDPGALAEAILKLKEDRQFYENSAKNARKLAVQRYSITKLAQRIETLIERPS